VNARQQASRPWDWDDSSEHLTAAMGQATCLAVREVRDLLQEIKGLMLSLGNDGLHTLIRDAARAARRREKTRLAKRRATRRAK